MHEITFTTTITFELPLSDEDRAEVLERLSEHHESIIIDDNAVAPKHNIAFDYTTQEAMQ